jgi:hypothetical protein
MIAPFSINPYPSVFTARDGISSACGNASVAFGRSDAFFNVVRQFRRKRSAFRVGAPTARQGAALQKNERSDPRTVMKRKFLDVENETFSPGLMKRIAGHGFKNCERFV